DHLVSGLHPATDSPYSDSLSLRLPYPVKLATECKSLTHYTKGTQSPPFKDSPTDPACWICFILCSFGADCAAPKALKGGLLLFVCTRFQDLFHSPSGVLFAFPSRYWFTIGRSRVFSLGGWSPHLQTGFHVSRPTYLTLSSSSRISSTGLSPAMAGLSIPFDYPIA